MLHENTVSHAIFTTGSLCAAGIDSPEREGLDALSAMTNCEAQTDAETPYGISAIAPANGNGKKNGRLPTLDTLLCMEADQFNAWVRHMRAHGDRHDWECRRRLATECADAVREIHRITNEEPRCTLFDFHAPLGRLMRADDCLSGRAH